MNLSHSSKTGFALLGFILASLTCISQSNAASFQGLGDLPGGVFNSLPYAVSANGSVVVGGSESDLFPEAFRWENGIMTGLGSLPSDGATIADGISADGSVVVGESGLWSAPFEAWRWENGIMTGLGDLPGGGFGSMAFDVSADGSVVVGRGQSDSGYEAFRWEDGEMVGLGDLPGGGFFSHAYGVSADGLVVVGVSDLNIFDMEGEAFRWEDDIMTGLGDLPGGGFFSHAYDVSADGLVVVGSSESDLGEEAFRWENDTMVGLGGLVAPWDGSTLESRAYGVSADGSVVVGESFSLSDPISGRPESHQAFIWTAEDGMLNLQELLETRYGLDLTGWMLLTSATAISDDGLTIVGTGISPNGAEGWIAVIPEPATILLLGLGGLALRCRRISLRR